MVTRYEWKCPECGSGHIEARVHAWMRITGGDGTVPDVDGEPGVDYKSLKSGYGHCEDCEHCDDITTFCHEVDSRTDEELAIDAIREVADAANKA